jgi:hypothetical protein
MCVFDILIEGGREGLSCMGLPGILPVGSLHAFHVTHDFVFLAGRFANTFPSFHIQKVVPGG